MKSRWWKCDLQVATPAWRFARPPGSGYNFDDPADRVAFLDQYMEALKRSGVEVIALADHNTGAWIDHAKAAGERNGIVVFPGCEITTHTGADGCHVLLLGDLGKTTADFDHLIHGPCGFDDNNPTFHLMGDTRVPGSSPKTLLQILDALPDGYLAIAPHAFSENGVASRDSVNGDIRWKSLNHERLVAIDPGDCSSITGNSFKARFVRRELQNFPRLKDLAFVATSDAYSLEELGSRFTWIRMGEPSLEALRQAFLDHEARVLCDWSERLAEFPQRSPTYIRHAWISDVSIKGASTNPTDPLDLEFHSNLNVIIGGRGSGKSTIVAALRQLYSSTSKLPKRLRDDADSFVDTVFRNATLCASHRVSESQQLQRLSWTYSTRSQTDAGVANPGDFPVTVISQKELFERAAGDKNDPFVSSRCLLELVDDSIGYSADDSKGVDSFGRRLADACNEWSSAIREQLLLEGDLAQLDLFKKREKTLEGQVAAFASAQTKARLSRIDAFREQEKLLDGLHAAVSACVTEAGTVAGKLAALGEVPIPAATGDTNEFDQLVSHLVHTASEFAIAISQAAVEATKSLAQFDLRLSNSDWRAAVHKAQLDLAAYQQELFELGLSPDEFTRVREGLEGTRARIAALEEMRPKLEAAQRRTHAAWEEVLAVLTERREAREQLLKNIENQSGRLRFRTSPFADTSEWVESVRSLAGFRSDAFLEDVPALGAWLWENAEARDERWELWRHALSTGDLREVQSQAQLRQPFAERIAKLDEAIRLRLATLIPNDVVQMLFLSEGGRPERDEDWQSITEGSPGQRTAAMLAFVLHHGREPLVLDQPEDDLDSEWISRLVVTELRRSRWHRQLIIVSHNANIPVLGDADQVIALENRGNSLAVRSTCREDGEGRTSRVLHVGPVENRLVRTDIQNIMEGGVAAFVRRERRYNNEVSAVRRNN